MNGINKSSARHEKSVGYASLVRLVAENYKRFLTSPVNVYDCLNWARLNEKNAVGAENSRQALLQESPPADPPPELSDKAIADYYLQAARMYDAAGTYAVLHGDLYRAFKRFRKAAKCGSRCNEILVAGDPEVLAAIEKFREKAVVTRYEIARRSVRRKKLTFGLARRMR